VFWNYERNLAKEDPNRTDIVTAVWGNVWTNSEDPGSAGIALGQPLSYVVNVYENVDLKDNPKGYAGDAHYFKAGLYNQCSTKNAPGVWYAACPGTGDWETDKANGDYAQATFSRLVVRDPKPM